MGCAEPLSSAGRWLRGDCGGSLPSADRPGAIGESLATARASALPVGLLKREVDCLEGVEAPSLELACASSAVAPPASRTLLTTGGFWMLRRIHGISGLRKYYASLTLQKQNSLLKGLQQVFRSLEQRRWQAALEVPMASKRQHCGGPQWEHWEHWEGQLAVWLSRSWISHRPAED